MDHYENYPSSGPFDDRDGGAGPQYVDGDEDATPWGALGRGSAAGRLVFNLYNRDTTGRARGNSYSQVRAGISLPGRRHG